MRAEDQRFASHSSAALLETGPLRIQLDARAGDKARVQQSVSEAIREASQRTGVEYEYLLTAAYIESGLDPEARARTSSASGLFQFIESTWLSSLDRHRARLGLVAQTPIAAPGALAHGDMSSRRARLALRHDPKTAALIAAADTMENEHSLRSVLGRRATHAELYMAHFLGSAGAARFLRAWRKEPAASAARLFPKAARANAPIFYTNGGTARSLDGVRSLIAEKHRRSARRMNSALYGAGQGEFNFGITKLNQVIRCHISERLSDIQMIWPEPAIGSDQARHARFSRPRAAGRQHIHGTDWNGLSYPVKIVLDHGVMEHSSDTKSAIVDQSLPAQPGDNVLSKSSGRTLQSAHAALSLCTAAQGPRAHPSGQHTANLTKAGEPRMAPGEVREQSAQSQQKPQMLPAIADQLVAIHTADARDGVTFQRWSVAAFSA